MGINFKLTKAEERLASLLWDNAPIASMEMIKLAEREIGWKKSTTFFNLNTLIKKGVAQNLNSRVTMLYTRDQLISMQSRHYVEETFGGSLPKFITSFTGGKKLTPEQVDGLRRLIDESTGEADRTICQTSDTATGEVYTDG